MRGVRVSQSRFLGGISKLLAGRGKCAIFTVQKQSLASMPTVPSPDECWGKPRLTRLSRKMRCSTAPNPVRGLWTTCTRLKRQVLTNAHFSLTENVEGVQQDRSLTAS